MINSLTILLAKLSSKLSKSIGDRLVDAIRLSKDSFKDGLSFVKADNFGAYSLKIAFLIFLRQKLMSLL